MVHRSGPIFCLWLSKVSANERRRYICNVFSHWQRPCSAIHGKWPKISNSKWTSDMSPSQVNYGMSVVRIMKKIGRVINMMVLTVHSDQRYMLDGYLIIEMIICCLGESSITYGSSQMGGQARILTPVWEWGRSLSVSVTLNVDPRGRCGWSDLWRM